MAVKMNTECRPPNPFIVHSLLLLHLRCLRQAIHYILTVTSARDMLQQLLGTKIANLRSDECVLPTETQHVLEKCEQP